MNYLKSLVEPAFHSKLGVKIRNFTGFKPAAFVLPRNISKLSCSDLFFWRLDDEFTTSFRFSDIPATFFGAQKSSALIVFYDSKGREIYREIFELKKALVNLDIDADKIGARSSYGTFSIFHLFDVDNHSDVRITNRCYVGYKRGSSLPSFVHGNILAQYINLSDENKDIVHNKVAQIFGTCHGYTIQKKFGSFDYSELAFVNPTRKDVWVEINSQRTILGPRCSCLLRIEGTDVVTIKSNLPMPRPIVFSFQGGYLDCHHA